MLQRFVHAELNANNWGLPTRAKALLTDLLRVAAAGYAPKQKAAARQDTAGPSNAEVTAQGDAV